MERLLIIDPGDTTTRAAAYDLEGAEPRLLGRSELESAALIVDPGTPRAPGIAIVDPVGGAAALVGEPAADLAGADAFLAASPDAWKLHAIVRALLYRHFAGGERVRVLLIADAEGEKAERLGELAAAIDGERVDVTVAVGLEGRLDARTFEVGAEVEQAGLCLHERADALGLFDGDRPVAALDIGHRTSRFSLLDPEAGIVDTLTIPTGGATYVEHVLSRGRELGALSCRETPVLRQIRAGTALALDLGGVTVLAGRLLDAPHRALDDALAAEIGSRLSRRVEQGAPPPGALLVSGALARAHLPTLANRLAARGHPFARQAALPPAPTPLIEGALRLALGAGATLG